MSPSLAILALACVGVLVAAFWGHMDKRIDHSPGATLAVVLLMGAIGCALSGHMVPEGAVLLALAVFVWLFTMGSLLDRRRLQK
jgi:uncharacterized membrane protein YfcA